MKKSIPLFLLAIILSFMSGCKKNKEITPNDKKSDQELIEIYSKVGEYHNKGVDNLYKFFKNIADNHTHNRTDSVTEITFLEANQVVGRFLIDSLGFPEINMTPYYLTDTTYKNPTDLYENSTLVSHYSTIYGQSMSSDLSAALNEVENVFRNDTKPTHYEKYDSLIQIKVSLIQNQTDKAAFVGCVSTLKNSYQYWNENKDKWDSLQIQLSGNHERNGVSNRGDPIKDIVWADGSGALVGLIRGAVIGAGGGTIVIPGIGTVTGAAAGGLAGGFVGGVMASGGSAIHSFLQWLVNW